MNLLNKLLSPIKKRLDNTDIQNIEFENYSQNIIDNQDKILFDEACKAIKAGALRGAYILLFVCALESLKRKFNDIGQLDKKAKKIATSIQNTESNKQSPDFLILKRSSEYGLISEETFRKLDGVRTLRNLYSHPSESAPKIEDLNYILSIITKEVLFTGTYLNEQYVYQLINKLAKNKNYLPNYNIEVYKAAERAKNKIQRKAYKYLIINYLDNIYGLNEDHDYDIIQQRAVWFLSKFLELIDLKIFSEEEWHELILKHFNTLSFIFENNSDAYTEIGETAQHTFITNILDTIREHPDNLSRLEVLYDKNLLNNMQSQLFLDTIINSDNNIIWASKIKITKIFDLVIINLKTYDWYINQNPAVDYLFSQSYENLNDLTNKRQEILGRNILQAAQGSSNSACQYINEIAQGKINVPYNVLKGILLECFVNERNEFRVKIDELENVIAAVNISTDKDRLLDCLKSSLNLCTFNTASAFRYIISYNNEDTTTDQIALEKIGQHSDIIFITEYIENKLAKN